MTFIRTITGEIAPERLGLTLFHEQTGHPPAEVVEADLCSASEWGAGDMARKSYWRVCGAGFRHLPETICPLLTKAGLTEAYLEHLFGQNPRDWLQFEGA